VPLRCSGKFLDGIVFESSRARGFAFEFELGCGQVRRIVPVHCVFSSCMFISLSLFLCTCACVQDEVGYAGCPRMGHCDIKDVQRHAWEIRAAAGTCVRSVALSQACACVRVCVAEICGGCVRICVYLLVTGNVLV
jgi:hypothetical protein